MASSRFAGQQIESWNPAYDVRSIEAGRLFVLEGKNYLFDAKGPKSGFGNRILHGGAIGADIDIQSVDVGKNTLIMSSAGIWRQEYAAPEVRDVFEPTTYWNKLITFDSKPSIKFANERWTGAYLNGISYVAHPTHGLLKVFRNRIDIHDSNGVPAKPVAIAELAGRLIVVNKDIFAFSAAGDGKNFIPALAAAGYQKLNQYLSGAPIAISIFAQGCVIWSRTSAMTAEFIGGDAVFRYDTLKTKLYPLGPMAVTGDANGRNYMMTRHGLCLVDSTEIKDDVAPGFSEMIRHYLNENPETKVRLDYVLEDDLLYVQLSDSVNFFNQTFVLSVGIDKWGVFSEEHLGVCRFGSDRGSTGFADLGGLVRKWTDTADRELPGGVLVGLDSYIDIGYFHRPEMIPEADTIIEMQETVVSARTTFPKEATETVIDLMGLNQNEWWAAVSDSGESIFEDWQTAKYFYDEEPNPNPVLAEDEDWGGGEVYTEDYQFTIGAENWGIMPLSRENWNLAVYEANTPFEFPEDWTLADTVGTTTFLLDFMGGNLVTFGSAGTDSTTLNFISGRALSYGSTYDWNLDSEDDIDWGADTFLHPVPIGVDEDYMNVAADQDWEYETGLPSSSEYREPNLDYGVLSLDDSEDWMFVPNDTHVIGTPDIYDDWNVKTADDDMNGPYSLFNKGTYRLKYMSSFNGREWDIDVNPILAYERFNRDMWVAITSGRFQSMRFSAVDRWEKFHVTSIDVNLNYQGQQS